MQTKAREEVTRRRFTVEEFHRMDGAVILREDERVELIDGEIVQMNPIGSRHAACVRVLTRLLSRKGHMLASEALPNLTLHSDAVLG